MRDKSPLFSLNTAILSSFFLEKVEGVLQGFHKGTTITTVFPQEIRSCLMKEEEVYCFPDASSIKTKNNKTTYAGQKSLVLVPESWASRIYHHHFISQKDIIRKQNCIKIIESCDPLSTRREVSLTQRYQKAGIPHSYKHLIWMTVKNTRGEMVLAIIFPFDNPNVANTDLMSPGLLAQYVAKTLCDLEQ